MCSKTTDTYIYRRECWWDSINFQAMHDLHINQCNKGENSGDNFFFFANIIVSLDYKLFWVKSNHILFFTNGISCFGWCFYWGGGNGKLEAQCCVDNHNCLKVFLNFLLAELKHFKLSAIGNNSCWQVTYRQIYKLISETMFTRRWHYATKILCQHFSA